MIKAKASSIANDSALPGATVKDALDAAVASGLAPADRAKLDGIEDGATKNATDADLRDRATHTGTQSAGTISDFAAAARAVTETQLVAGSNVTITPVGDALVLSASGGGGGGLDPAALIHAAPAKPTPADADEVGYVDSVAGWGLKKLTFANLRAWIGSFFVSKSGDTINGNLNFSGTGRRITGDFSNATVANRTLFKTTTAGSPTRVGVVPNGTTTSEVFAANAEDPTNAQAATLTVTATEVRVQSTAFGTGTSNYLPLGFYTSGAERLRIDPATGNVLAVSGALGYGVGAGGTALQPTSNTSTVILNKQNGVITLANGFILGSAKITFFLQNSLISENSTVVAHGMFDGSSTAIALFTVQAEYLQTGYAIISVKNNAASSVATDGVKIRFAVFAGSAS